MTLYEEHEPEDENLHKYDCIMDGFRKPLEIDRTSWCSYLGDENAVLWEENATDNAPGITKIRE